MKTPIYNNLFHFRENLRLIFVGFAAVTVPISIIKCILQFVIWRRKKQFGEIQENSSESENVPLNSDITDGPLNAAKAIAKIDDLIQNHELDENVPWTQLKQQIREKLNVQSNGNNNVQ